MIDERDTVIEAVRGRLRASVADQADPRAVARILSAAFAAPAPSRWRRWLDAWHLPVMSRVGAAVVAVIALAIGSTGARGAPESRAGRPDGGDGGVPDSGDTGIGSAVGCGRDAVRLRGAGRAVCRARR